MTIPTLIEVRYKPFSKLDYISGYSAYFLPGEVPTLTRLLGGLTDEYDEMSIRVVPEADVEALTANLITAEVEDEVDSKFYDIVGEEKPQLTFDDLFTDNTFISETAVIYPVTFSDACYEALKAWWYDERP